MLKVVTCWNQPGGPTVFWLCVRAGGAYLCRGCFRSGWRLVLLSQGARLNDGAERCHGFL